MTLHVMMTLLYWHNVIIKLMLNSDQRLRFYNFIWCSYINILILITIESGEDDRFSDKIPLYN